jgi:hypothetical protein
MAQRVKGKYLVTHELLKRGLSSLENNKVVHPPCHL